MQELQEMLDFINDDIIWSQFVLVPLLLLTGLFLTIRLRLLQFHKLLHALWLALIRRKDRPDVEGDISHYQALSTALAATVGVGNIAGAALAINIGGPGALFWMWMTGLVGMATKYSEAVLGVKYRRKDSVGKQSGGPMFYLRHGLPGGLGMTLGFLFAVFGAIAAFGIGNGTQANTVAQQLEDVWTIPPMVTGAVLVILVAAVIIGGIKSIGRVAAGVVPVMVLIYIAITLFILLVHVGDIPAALGLVFTSAFTGSSAVGGFAGATVLVVIQQGVERGIFSNESGLGTGAIAAAAAKTDQPVRQGLVSMTQTFIDTLIVVTMTCLTIIVTGVWQVEEPEDGSLLTSRALEEGLGAVSPALGSLGGYIVALAVMIFAFTTLLGWSYYGDRCIDYLVGHRGVVPYRVLFVAVVFVGATAELDLVWTFSGIANGLMALPNLVGLILLAPIVVSETKRYFANPDWKDPDIKVPDVRS
ncbi:AGCS family alanine or glycine:cation symporter [Lipingzhangella halophila]|uniref:AGCS family alanine or glycine:cation symporter n=1 Tax=Lipingzhangella halophila TaxID=1783352 RepID=A0A7W7W0R0_9ACTN|nr:sodium:alanine symporter family protein [Lipingzhangella halophila]MBB4930177.1 AGCS family alanine or glycine:cation symporter [Lipingzhangella halophila]